MSVLVKYERDSIDVGGKKSILVWRQFCNDIIIDRIITAGMIHSYR